MDNLNFFLLLVTAGFFFLFTSFSIYEKKYKAGFVSAVFMVLTTMMWILFIIWNSRPVIMTINVVVILFFFLFVIVSIIGYFPPKKLKNNSDIEKFDERDHMFSRMVMQKYGDKSDTYYKNNPDKRTIDRKIAKDPNLGDPGAKYYDMYFSPVANSAFSYLDRTAGARTGEVFKRESEHEPSDITRVIKWIAKYYGAIDVGITEIKDHHLYSHHGRQEHNWGDPVKNAHRYGIVIVVEMDQDMIKQAPSLPVLLESSKQYVESAKIAHLIGEYIRELGYTALAHVDGNYDVLAVPMAEDAGLGKTGRMGILVHRKLGPSVRLSIVTTDAPLIISEGKDEHIEEFCAICKKCAVNCPTNSIPAGDKPVSRNFEHWSADQQTCYALWRKTGTDCGFCIRVCPYTKKDTLIHRIVRLYISRNPINQRLALMMDNIFYGRKFNLIQRNDPGTFRGSQVQNGRS